MSESTQKPKTGLSGKQLFLLFIAFMMGVACVYTLDKTILAQHTPGSNTVQAATK